MGRLKTWAMPLAILLYWQLIASSGLVSQYLLPPPYKVWLAAVELWDSGALQHNSLTSLGRVFAGFGISCSIAFLLALAVNASRTVVSSFGIKEPFRFRHLEATDFSAFRSQGISGI